MKAQERAPGRGGMRSSSSGSRPPGPARRDGRLRRRRVGGDTAGPQLDRVCTRKGPQHCGRGSAVSEHAGYGPESEPCRWALQLERGAPGRWGESKQSHSRWCTVASRSSTLKLKPPAQFRLGVAGRPATFPVLWDSEAALCMADLVALRLWHGPITPASRGAVGAA